MSAQGAAARAGELLTRLPGLLEPLMRGAQRLGNETINGIPTVHYKLDASGLEVMGYLNGDGDVWVAESGNYVVKYTFQATGSDKFFGGSSTSEGTGASPPVICR